MTGRNPYELRLQIWKEAREHLVHQYIELKERQPDSKKKYPTNKEIIALAKQIREFADDKGKEYEDFKYSSLKELLKEQPDAKTIRSLDSTP